MTGGDTHAGLFRYLMARCDGGLDRTIRVVATRVPGKGIWIAEWSAHDAGNCAGKSDTTTPRDILNAI